ncbi:hypothetical protein OROMI_033761 [Orobanche minor]
MEQLEFLGRLKKKVTNRNKVEASIVNAYLNEEVSRFCSLYFQPSIQTKLNRVPHNDDGGIVDSRGSISVYEALCVIEVDYMFEYC